MSIHWAVKLEIEASSGAVQASPLAAVALHLAELLQGEEDGRNAATLSRELRATMGELRALAAVKPAKGDTVDDLSARRTRRQSAS